MEPQENWLQHLIRTVSQCGANSSSEVIILSRLPSGPKKTHFLTGQTHNGSSAPKMMQELSSVELKDMATLKVPSNQASSKAHVVLEGTTLSIVGQENMGIIPKEYGEKYGRIVTELTIRSCDLRTVSNLSQFRHLSVLVLDNNCIGDENEFPSILNLETLWLNNNKISRLEQFLKNISKSFPQLSYLSLLRNPCCPNYLVGKTSSDYLKYREKCIGTLPTLRFLDTTPVTPKERAAAMVSQASVTRLTAADYKKKVDGPLVSPDKGLNKVQTNTVDDPSAGQSKYIYVGKHSEGNRFIRDKNL